MNRCAAYLVSLAFVIGAALAALGNPGDDSFPLSTYPMFSGRRRAMVQIDRWVDYVDGLPADTAAAVQALA